MNEKESGTRLFPSFKKARVEFSSLYLFELFWDISESPDIQCYLVTDILFSASQSLLPWFPFLDELKTVYDFSNKLI